MVENRKVIDAKMDENAKECINGSMSIIEKVQSLLHYFKTNYPMDTNAPQFQGEAFVDNDKFLQFLRPIPLIRLSTK